MNTDRKTITGRYNRYGYVIEIDGEEVYRAGNHPLESSQISEPTGHSLSLKTLAAFCQQTADEIADEIGGIVGEIKHYLGAKKL